MIYMSSLKACKNMETWGGCRRNNGAAGIVPMFFIDLQII
jgi:hypothetical protein